MKEDKNKEVETGEPLGAACCYAETIYERNPPQQLAEILI